jgi:predicted ATP-dependent protease
MSESTTPRELTPSDLGPVLSPPALNFQTTDELEPLDVVFGQDRALKALELGVSIRQRGYNIYASGISGMDKKGMIQRLLEERARNEPTPDDWVYVFNFDEPDCPLAVRLPGGQGSRLRASLDRIVERLGHDLPEALKAEDFSAERNRLGSAFGKRGEQLYEELVEHAQRLRLNVQRQPNGVLNIIPLKDGRPMEPAEFEQLGQPERADFERRQEELGQHLAQLMAQQQELMHDLHEAVEEIVRTFARRILDPLFAQARTDFPGESLAGWLDGVREHLLANLGRLNEAKPEPSESPAVAEHRDRWLECRVNVVADHARTQGAPLLVELSPSYKNLFGTIEHDVNLFGRVTTDFTRIKSGSLLRASGGYLILDLADAVTEPLVWKQLKRALRSGQLLTEAYDPLSLFTAGALRPQPIPIETKVVAVGSGDLYYFLLEADEDFTELFKIRADFGEEPACDAAGRRSYARFIAKMVKEDGLLAFNAAAVAEVIRFGVRRTGDRGKLSVDLGAIADLLRETSHWARLDGAATVGEDHVRRALDQRVYRSERIAVKIRELILQGALRVALEGRCVGEINGLPILHLGDLGFGWPSRLTAAVGIGQEGVVNIEHEAKLSGNIFDKGMLILEGYLRHRYGRRHPLAISASLAFEQSYGWVEGDSAASTELYCLLSALADVPLRQDIAVTGSVDQHGQVQVVGAINEKIEGFFDVCRQKGLTGTQGVCIPHGNIVNLVLRHDVIQAVAEGQFHIWAVDTIDEGLELLTGMPAGAPDVEGTFHHRLDQRLLEMLNLLEEKPAAGLSPRLRLAMPGGERPPSPPPLPGQES